MSTAPESPLASYDAQINDLRAQIAPLQDALSAVAKERREFADLLAEETDDLHVLADLLETSQVAYRKFDDAIRTRVHRPMTGHCSWLPDTEGAEKYLLGVQLHLTPRDHDTDVAVLARDMTGFATEFCPDPGPVANWYQARRAGVSVDDMVYANVVDAHCGEYGSYEVWFTPDGERAYLLHSNSYRGPVAEGHLADVLAALIPAACIRRSDDD